MECKFRPTYYSLDTWEWIPWKYAELPDYSHAVTYDGCTEQALPSQKYCIFHSHEKETSEFTERFRELYLKNEKIGQHKYIGFVFPEDFSFHSFFRSLGKRPIGDYAAEIVNANFYGAIFKGSANFRKLHFSGDKGTNFMHAKFLGGEKDKKPCADFTLSKFSGNGRVNFYFTKFIGGSGVSFYWTIFENTDRINFARAVFAGEGQVKFSQAQFRGDNFVYFDNTYFSMLNGVSFRNARLLYGIRLVFSNTHFDGLTIVDFRDMDVFEAGRITLDRVDVSRFLFSGTYLRNIDFRETYFYIDFNKPRYGFYRIWWPEFLKKHFFWQGWEDLVSGVKKLLRVRRSRVFDEVIYFENKEYIISTIKAALQKSEYRKELENLVSVFAIDELWVDNIVQLIIDKYVARNEKKEVLDEQKELENKSKIEKRKYTQKTLNRIKDRGKRDIFWNLVNIIKTDNKDVYVRLRDNLVSIDGIKNKLESLIEELKNESYREEYKIKQVYSQKRLAYEDSGRYHEAGEFFIGEMEMRKKLEKNRRYMLGIYKLFSLYGERPSFAAFWILAAWFLFSLSHIYFGMGPNTQIQVNDQVFRELINWDVGLPSAGIISLSSIYKWAYSLWQGFLIVLSNLTLGRFVAPYMLDPDSGWSPLFRGFEFLFGAVTIPLFVLAMNRKFRRTKD